MHFNPPLSQLTNTKRFIKDIDRQPFVVAILVLHVAIVKNYKQNSCPSVPLSRLFGEQWHIFHCNKCLIKTNATTTKKKQ